MLMKPEDWLDLRFGKTSSRPTIQSVTRWIKRGALPGEKVGGRFFVEYDPGAPNTGSAIADRILKAS